MGPFVRSDLFDLTEFQLHRSGATENEHSHLDATLFVVNFFNDAVEISERTVHDTDSFTRLKQRFRLRLVTAISNTTQDCLSLFLGDRRRLVANSTPGGR